MASRGRANGGVDWILTAIGTRQRRKRQNLPVVKLRHRMDRHHGKLVARQRSGLVRTENIDAAGLIDGGQARRQHTLAGQSAGTDRRCEREHRRQRDGNRRQHCHEDERNDISAWHGQPQRIDRQQNSHGAVEQRQIAHDTQNGLLLRAFNLRALNEFGRPSEFGPCPRSNDFSDGFPASYQSACIGLRARPGLDRQGLAREHGLIDQDRSIEDAHVGRDDGAERQLDQITRHERSRRNRRPTPVPLHGCDERQP